MKNNYLVDTHCHMSLTDDIDSIIMDAEKNNVLKFIISGCDKKSIRDGLEIIYRYPSIFMTVGFHPDEVDELTDKDINDLESIELIELNNIIRRDEENNNLTEEKRQIIEEILSVELTEEENNRAKKIELTEDKEDKTGKLPTLNDMI